APARQSPGARHGAPQFRTRALPRGRISIRTTLPGGRRTSFGGQRVAVGAPRLSGMAIMATVLIVEDDDQVRVLAESHLGEEGPQPAAAGDAEEALAVFEVVPRIDVLFADINLRGDLHAGLELAKRARGRQADLAVLYTTGQAVTDGMRAMMVEKS